MKVLFKVVVMFVLFIFISCAAFAGGGGGLSSPCEITVRGLPGWEYLTSSTVTAAILPSFYNDGEGDVDYVAMPHSDQLTVAYWMNNGSKLSTQTLAKLNESGTMQYEGFVEVGANDTRSSLTFDWYACNYESSYTWYIQMYSRDTHALVFRELISPDTATKWGSVTTKTSRSGYDILAASWIETPVPEPGSFVVMSSGLIGLVGFVLRRKK